MLRNSYARSALVAAALVLVAVGGYFGLGAWKAQALEKQISACVADEGSGEARQIDCLYDIVRGYIARDGITRALQIFSIIYDKAPVISTTGCHTHAHRIGDMAFYEIYLPTQSLDAMDLGVETGACGYGFYHGLLEHLVQSHPTPEFVTETCEYLEKRLINALSDVRQICYHGSGHGFMLAHVESLSEQDWGNLETFVAVPLTWCNALARATERERSECREGVFNVIVEWMETKQFGFAYDYEDPLAFCEGEENEMYREACVYEAAMKLDSVASFSPTRLVEVVSSLHEEHLRVLAFSVGVAGMVQSSIVNDKYHGLFDECQTLDALYAEPCVRSVVNGLFEHGLPGREYERPLAMCTAEEGLSERLRVACFESFSYRIKRFYPLDQRRDICGEVPAVYQMSCERIVTQ